MKVIFVAHSIDVYAGSTKALLSLLEGLMKRSVIPLVILPKKEKLTEILQSKGIAVFVLDYRMAVYPPMRSLRDYVMFLPRLLGRIWLNKRAYLQLCDIAKEFRPDIIHTNVSVIDVGYRVAKQLKIPHIYHVREYGDKDFALYHYPMRFCFLRNLKRHSYAICITKDIQRHSKLNDNNSCVIYDGVLPKSQISFNRQKDNYFLFAGRLEPAKGILELLKAFADFCFLRPDLDIKLKIAGDTSISQYRNFLLNEIKRMKVANKVEFLGMRKDILDLMSKAYLMIVPSRSEGFGFITAEAQFNGALVLGLDTAGTKEQFDNGLEITGEEIALRYTTHQELVKAMCDVLDNGVEYYFPMIERSQIVVRKLYTTESCSMNVYNLYKRILNT